MASSILSTKNATFIVGKIPLATYSKQNEEHQGTDQAQNIFQILYFLRETKIELKINIKILKLLPSSWTQKR
jgi:hypothetical protein